MNTLRTIDIMKQCALLNWQTLMVGWNYGWVKKQDVIDYAVERLRMAPEEMNNSISLLAGAEDFDDEEVSRLLAGLSEPSADENCNMDKWRLAHLLELQQADLLPDKKLDLLEELYAVFGYPSEMRLCSRYGPSQEAINKGMASPSDLEIAPLDAMREVIKTLKFRLGVR